MQVDFVFDFYDFLKSNRFDAWFESKKYSLVLHNSDAVLTLENLDKFLGLVDKIYCVNILEESNRVKALPIGLENRKKLRNGVERDYVVRGHYELQLHENRETDFLACFNLLTNPRERISAVSAALDLPNSKVIMNAVTPKAHREHLKNSKFVISPPGNGPDCHRTWEALYMNAIPIVKKEFWPFKEINIPVIQIEDWNSTCLAQTNLMASHKFSFRDSPVSDPIFWLTR
jgi:hypothetical protein